MAYENNLKQILLSQHFQFKSSKQVCKHACVTVYMYTLCDAKNKSS